MTGKLMKLTSAMAAIGCWADAAFAKQRLQPVIAPEFDGPGGIAAIALLVSVGALLYSKARR